MKRTIMAIAIATTMVAGAAVAGGNYNPASGYSGYEGIGGAVSASSTSIAGTSITNGSTYGSQYGVSNAYNTTQAGASATPMQAGPNVVGLNVTAHTASNGYSNSRISGSGDGTVTTMAAQGGLANAYAGGDVYNSDKTVIGGKQRCGPPKPLTISEAEGWGSIQIGSTAGQASGSAITGVGPNVVRQGSSAEAENNTDGFVSVYAHTLPGAAKVEVETEINSTGSTMAEGTGMSGLNAIGASGAIAGQAGGGYAVADGYTKLTRMEFQGPPRGPQTMGKPGGGPKPMPRPTVTDSQSGWAHAEAGGGVSSLTVVGGMGDWYGSGSSSTLSENQATGMVKAKFTEGGVRQETAGRSSSWGSANSTARSGFNGQAVTVVDSINGSALGFGLGDFGGQSGNNNSD